MRPNPLIATLTAIAVLLLVFSPGGPRAAGKRSIGARPPDWRYSDGDLLKLGRLDNRSRPPVNAAAGRLAARRLACGRADWDLRDLC